MPALALACLLVLVLDPQTPADDAKGRDFFEKKIRPVLVEKCAECHAAPVGKKAPKGGFRVDSRDALRKGGDSGPAVVEGKPDESILLEVIRYRDAVKMPPKGKLPDTVIADFEQWIKMGAPDPRRDDAPRPAKAAADAAAGRDYFAYRPLKPTPTPEVKDRAWPANEVDRYILKKLEDAGLKPAPEADRAVLIRRLYFDLVGLPPTPEEIRAFQNDARPDAYERLVDRLLQSRAFGERWGRHWLDIARFAESVTLRGLIHKEAWRYRDYVIEAFNADRPIDTFIREQIAGDLLTSDSIAERGRQLVATAYLSVGNWNLEEQDKDQLRMDVVDEQLDVIGKGLLAQTITCARCHDHKFDPIPTRDYYSLAGILRNAKSMEHENVSKWVERPLPMSPKEEEEVARAEKAVAALNARIKAEKAKLAKSGKAGASGIVDPTKLPGLVIDDQKAKRVGSWTLSKFSKNYIGDGYLHDENGGKGEKTLTFQPEKLPPGEYELQLAYTPGGNRAGAVPVTVMSADGEKVLSINLKVDPPVDGRFVSLGKYRFEKDGLAYVMVSNEGTNGHVVVDAVRFLSPEAAATALTKPSDIAAARSLKNLEAELKALTKQAPQREMTSSVVEEKTIEDTKVHVRGNVHVLGEPAPRGFLRVIGAKPVAMPSNESGRRELADWLVSPENPLTTRVFVNRVWHWLFGAGLVRTPDNFGTTGELPTHPELLDRLALDFRADGWSVKRLIKRLVMSRTYRQSSRADARATAADPDNRLWSRAFRRRLDAESVHDAILVVSGRLKEVHGGPTFPGTLAADYGYAPDETTRAVFIPVFRNALPEFFDLFDFADTSVVTGKRNAATVAPQALYMLNHPFVMEQARAAAARFLKAEPDASARVDSIYVSALGRPASPSERKLALDFLAETQKAAKPMKDEEAWGMLIQAVFASPDFRSID